MALRLTSRLSGASPVCKSLRKVVPSPVKSVGLLLVRRNVVAAAEAESESGAEKLIAKVSMQFDKAENKAAIVGYAVGGFAAIMICEWLMHLPVLSAVIGFPVQLVGLLMLPTLITRYALDGKDLEADVESALGDITKKLPGL